MTDPPPWYTHRIGVGAQIGIGVGIGGLGAQNNAPWQRKELQISRGTPERGGRHSSPRGGGLKKGLE